MERKIVKIDYTNKDIFVGIDVHSTSWYVTVIVEDYIKSQTFSANAAKLAEYLKREYPGGTYYAGYEAGCFGFHIKEKLDKLNVSTIVINPADIPTSDKESRNKTDLRDSQKIALCLKSGLVKGIYAPDRASLEIRMLSRRRSDISGKTTRVKNQIKAVLKLYGIEYPQEFEESHKYWSKNFILWLSQIEFVTIEGKIAMDSFISELEFFRQEKLKVLNYLRALTKSEKFKEQSEVLISIPGIGAVSTVTVLTELINVERFETRDKYLSYIGLTPNEHSSGEKRRIGSLTKRCNRSLRTVFIEASWIAVRRDPALSMYYTEVHKKIGKQKAIIKVARKLATRVRYLLLNMKKYEYGHVA
jgi:transposase